MDTLKNQLNLEVVITVKYNSERASYKNIKTFHAGKSLLDIKLIQLLKIFNNNQITILGNSTLFAKYADQYQVTFSKIKDSNSIEDMIDSILASTKSDNIIRACVTTPFLNEKTILNMWEIYLNHKDQYDSCVCVEKIQTHMLSQHGNRLNYGLGLDYLMSQEIEPVFCVKSGIFIFNRKTSQRLHYFIGNRPYLYECSALQSIDINNEEDFTQAQLLLSVPELKKCIE